MRMLHLEKLEDLQSAGEWLTPGDCVEVDSLSALTGNGGQEPVKPARFAPNPVDPEMTELRIMRLHKSPGRLRESLHQRIPGSPFIDLFGRILQDFDSVLFSFHHPVLK